MNPIPLRHNRTVYAWACGRCHTLGDKSSGCYTYWRAGKKKHIDDGARASRAAAERCCLCDDCNVTLPEGWCGGVCEACGAKRKVAYEAALEESARREAERRRRNDEAIARGGGDPKAAEVLLTRMGDLAEERYCAGWPTGWESTLWAEAVGGFDTEGRRLVRLSREAGGWWAWSDDDGVPMFVPIAEWAQRVAGRAD